MAFSRGFSLAIRAIILALLISAFRCTTASPSDEVGPPPAVSTASPEAAPSVVASVGEPTVSSPSPADAGEDSSCSAADEPSAATTIESGGPSSPLSASAAEESSVSPTASAVEESGRRGDNDDDDNAANSGICPLSGEVSPIPETTLVPVSPAPVAPSSSVSSSAIAAEPSAEPRPPCSPSSQPTPTGEESNGGDDDDNASPSSVADMPLIAASSEVDAAADADSSVWSLLVPGTEDEERTEGNDLSLNVYSLGLRRTRYQGEGPVPNPIVEPGYSFRLSRGDSVFCVPQDDCPYLTGSVVILVTQPSSAGTNESLGRDRSWSVVRGSAGLCSSRATFHGFGNLCY